MKKMKRHLEEEVTLEVSELENSIPRLYVMRRAMDLLKSSKNSLVRD